jgi:hypothetical protein
MKRTLLLSLLLLLCAAWLMAQQQGSTSGDSQSSRSGNETTIQGCLSGSEGNFTLTDDSGNTYQLKGATSKLSKHVGHEVQITGATTESAAATSPTTGTPTSAAQRTLDVKTVKHVSTNCTASKK